MSINVMEDGKSKRRFIPLELEREEINLLNLSWTVVHPLDEKSPLNDLSKQDLLDGQAEIIVMLKAFDDSFSQTVHSRTSYNADDVIFDAKFEKVISTNKDGVAVIEMYKVSSYSI